MDVHRVWFRCLVSVVATLLCWASVHAQTSEPTTDSVRVRVVAQKSVVRPGDQIVIAVVLDHKEGYHTYPSVTQDVLPPALVSFAIRTEIEIKTKPDWIGRIDGIQWPEPHPSTAMNPEGEGTLEVPLYSEVAVAFIRLTIAENAALGDQRASVRLRFQACNDRTCDLPQNLEIPVTVKVVGPDSTETSTANEPALFSTFDQAGWGTGSDTGSAKKAKPIDFNVFGVIRFKLDPSGAAGILLLLLLAIVGGMLLNFTPCVLPVIPIKIIGLSNAAGNPRRCLMLGAVMSAGVVAFWLGIGAAMAFVTSFKSASALFQNPWVPLVFGVFMLAMGLGMFGAFTIKLPQAVYLLNPKNETVGGAFLFGIMTAVLSTPCTAPFGGAAMAWAAFQPPTTTLATFAAIGVGMALPYLILSANPRWVKKMPRTGPASELIKQLMGILMFAVAAYFVGQAVSVFLNTAPDPVARSYWWVVGLFVAAGGAWLAWRTVRISRKLVRRVAFGGMGVILVLMGVWIGLTQSSHGPVNWTHYTDQRFADARARGDVIVMDFTAEYCINCKALESTVLFRPDIAKILNAGRGIVPMKADIQVNDEAKHKQKEIKWVSIPLLAVFGPVVGYDEPIMMDWYTADQVKEAIANARGAFLHAP